MGPGSNKFCRACLIHRDEVNKHSTSTRLVIRGKFNYEEGLNRAKESTKGCDPSNGMKSYGCLLNETKYFHVIASPGFDIMHDILEGVGPFIFKLCMREWVLGETKLFEYNRFNKR